jgi:hypothetical protein
MGLGRKPSARDSAIQVVQIRESDEQRTQHPDAGHMTRSRDGFAELSHRLPATACWPSRSRTDRAHKPASLPNDLIIGSRWLRR